MKQNNKLGFTLIELLVVITILAIISVVAYQNFGGAVDKAVGSRKISDVSTIETALQTFKSDNNYYPTVDIYSGSTNVWGYNSGSGATPSNKIKVTFAGEEINTVNTGSSVGGGKVYGSGAVGQIGAKGTISMITLGKKYLSKDLYDPEVGDIKVRSTGGKLIDYGIGRYVYSVYKKSNWSTNQKGTSYNLAYTVKKEGLETYVTKIVGDYDENSCLLTETSCPNTLIGTLSGSTTNTYLKNSQEIGKTYTGAIITTYNSYSDLQGIPYAVTDFAP